MSDLFSTLRACPSCGAMCGPGGHCLDCQRAVAGPRSQELGLVGAVVTLVDGRRAVVVDSGPNDALTMFQNGAEQRVKLEDLARADGAHLQHTWSRAGALLASAAPLGMTDGGIAFLEARALALPFEDIREERGYLRDLLALERVELVTHTSLTPTEITWTRAVRTIAIAAPGASPPWADALAAMVDLPPERYVGRLAYFYAAATGGHIPVALREAVSIAAAGLRSSSPLSEVAWTAYALAAGESKSRSSLVTAVRKLSASAGPDSPWRQLLDAPAESRSSALLALVGATDLDPTQLPLLTDAPLELVDDLIDAGAISADVLSSAADLSAERREYIAARVDPSMLDDEALARQDLHFERARRAAIAGGRPTSDLPEDAMAHYEYLVALRRGDVEAVGAELARRSPELERELREVAHKGTLPSEELCSEPLVGDLLLARIDVNALDGIPAPAGERQCELLAKAWLRNARQKLYQWDWESARLSALECLRHASVEAVRDEALNVMAAALWQAGRDEEALAALRTAIDGEYTHAFQTNIAVVAAQLDPEVAATHLSRLVIEAPNIELRLAAARRAVGLWQSSDEPWADNDEALPPALAEALRGLVIADIPRDDFRELVQVLAWHDSDWLSRPNALRSSPHRETPEAKVWVARAKDLNKHIHELAKVLRLYNPPKWASDLRDEMVAAALGVLVVEDPPLPAVMFGMAILDEALPIDGDDSAVLRAFVARGAAMSIDPEEGEPAEKFLAWLEESQRGLGRLSLEARERALTAAEFGFHALAVSYLRARWALFQEAAQFHDSVVDTLRGASRWQVNRSKLRASCAPILSYCSETAQLMRRLRKHVTDADLRSAVDELLTAVDQLEQSTRQITS